MIEPMEPFLLQTDAHNCHHERQYTTDRPNSHAPVMRLLNCAHPGCDSGIEGSSMKIFLSDEQVMDFKRLADASTQAWRWVQR